MKISKKLLTVIAGSALICSAVFADPIADTKAAYAAQLQTGLNAFGSEILVASPQAATQQNVWSDAYIGNLPANFGFGATAGATKIDFTGFKYALSAFDNGAMSSKLPDTFALPVTSIDVRIGGIVLPFDIGLCAMMTNPNLCALDIKNPASINNVSNYKKQNIMGVADLSYDYLTLGIDFRYRVLKEGVVIPKVSVGAGYYFTRGAFGLNTNTDGNTATINVAYSTEVLFAQAQVSKNVLFMNLFAGGRALLPKTMVTYGYNYDFSAAATAAAGGTPVELKDSYEATVTKDYKGNAYQDSKFDFSMVQPQLYAGVSFNFLVVETTLSASCDVRSFFDSENYKDALWSAALAIHIDL